MDTLKLPAELARTLSASPHRLLFFIGASNVLAAMLWWTLWLINPAALPASSVPAGWMHAFILQYQVLPSFFFGFLITVFPRWMGLPEPTRWHYVPVGLGLFSGQLLCLLAMFSGSALALHLGVINTLAGWAAGLVVLGLSLLRERGTTWHALSCFAALLLGFAGLLGFAVYLHHPDPRLAFAVIKFASFGLLLPVYATVAHRMFPFFAANVVPGYVPWRPLWLLVAQWPLWLAHLALELMHGHAWLWLVDLPLLALATLSLRLWWPRGPMPSLLRVLFVGYAWLPIALALYAVQSLWMFVSGEFVLGRAPVHALSIGLFGSLLVAMVTRVTQGHSGRPLQLGRVALVAFVGMQIVAVLRVVGEVVSNPMDWYRAAALGWVLVFLPWVVGVGWINLRPRVDGRVG
jgi:uncharacterized protein involved in response to NO